MAQTITAVYENGILRPLEPLHLKEKQMVDIQISPTKQTQHLEDILQNLVKAGLLSHPNIKSELEPISEEARQEAANALGKAFPETLAQIIIEDRGDD